MRKFMKYVYSIYEQCLGLCERGQLAFVSKVWVKMAGGPFSKESECVSTRVFRVLKTNRTREVVILVLVSLCLGCNLSLN